MKEMIVGRQDHFRVAAPAVRNEMIELDFLLPIGQADALEAAAAHRGLTVGQLLRRLVGEFLQTDAPIAAKPSP